MAVKKNFSWMLVGRGVYAACQWFLIITIARLGAPDALGEFTYAVAITSPVAMLSQLNLRAFMMTDINEQFKFHDYLGTRLTTNVLAFMVVLVIVAMKDIAQSLVLLILVVAIYKLIESVSDVYHGILQKHEKVFYVSLSLMLHGITAMLSMVLSMCLFDSVLYGALLIFMAWLTMLFLYDMPVASKFHKQVFSTDWHKIWEVSKACFPLGVIMGLIALRVNVPVYFIEANLPIEQVGYYSAVAYFLVAGNLIITSLIQAAAPKLAYHYYHKETKKMARFLVKLILVAGIVGAVGLVLAILWGDLVLGIVYGQEFTAFKNLLVWVICAAALGFLAQILGLSLTVSRLFSYQMISNVVGTTSVVVFSYCLIPVYGIEGGGIALIAGNALIFIINLASVLKNRLVTFT